MSMFSRLLVAYDGSPDSQKALTRAAEFIADDSDIQVDIVNVMYPPSMYLYSLYGSQLSQEVLQEVDEKARQTILEAEELMDDYKDACQFIQLEGNARQELIDYADEHAIDLIIIGSRGLGAFKGMLLGSVSQHVVQNARCDVLVIK
ncbi:MAG TPA: universal stress protein [Virgibacillus sp.]|nr:universal stress protein [Virgibacillus sp.]